MSLGIIGVGHLASFVVKGLRRAGYGAPILLSPRNAAKAATLAQSHDCRVLPDNARVAREAEHLLLAVRPADLESALEGVAPRPGQLLISTLAGISQARLAALAPGTDIVLAMPLSAAAFGASPTLIYPDHGEARALLARLGPVIALPDQACYAGASANGALYGWLFALMAELEAANLAQGLSPETARQVTTALFQASAGAARKQADRPLPDILEELATPGGITAEGLARLGEAGAIAAWAETFAAIAQRLRQGQG